MVLEGDLRERGQGWMGIFRRSISLGLGCVSLLLSLEAFSSKAAQELKPALLFFVWAW